MNNLLNILVIGDVVKSQGCNFLRKNLPAFKKLKGIDLCIANGENSADGNGLTETSALHLFSSGVDIITSGNHVFKQRDVYEFLDNRLDVIRPANYSDSCPGKGYCIVDLGSVQVAIINIMGTIFLDSLENPFFCMDRILDDDNIKNCKIKIVDFHAEATSEKRALGFYLDGRVSFVFGTHTHVLTADEQILPNGTGYITDIGMTGPLQSVLGVKPSVIIDKLKFNMPVKFETPDSECQMNGCIFTVDKNTGKTVSVERINIM